MKIYEARVSNDYNEFAPDYSKDVAAVGSGRYQLSDDMVAIQDFLRKEAKEMGLRIRFLRKYKNYIDIFADAPDYENHKEIDKADPKIVKRAQEYVAKYKIPVEIEDDFCAYTIYRKLKDYFLQDPDNHGYVKDMFDDYIGYSVNRCDYSVFEELRQMFKLHKQDVGSDKGNHYWLNWSVNITLQKDYYVMSYYNGIDSVKWCGYDFEDFQADWDDLLANELTNKVL